MSAPMSSATKRRQLQSLWLGLGLESGRVHSGLARQSLCACLLVQGHIAGDCVVGECPIFCV